VNIRYAVTNVNLARLANIHEAKTRPSLFLKAFEEPIAGGVLEGGRKGYEEAAGWMVLEETEGLVTVAGFEYVEAWT
jgi:hypothetical protein